MSSQLLVWNHSSLSPVQTYMDHLAAVKAIAWSPHQHGLLASGGGTADRCIRFWNTLTSQPLQCMDTGSQVCNLAWSKHANELVSDFRDTLCTMNLLLYFLKLQSYNCYDDNTCTENKVLCVKHKYSAYKKKNCRTSDDSCVS